MELTEIWDRVFDIDRKEVAVPTVWLAMKAAKPLTIDGNFFVAALPPQEEYLESHLLDHQSATAIEEALQTVTGRVLAFRLIIGESLADWEALNADQWDEVPFEVEVPSDGPVEAAAEPPPAFFRSEYSAAPTEAAPTVRRPAPSASTREVSPTWEKLNERLSRGFKTAPYIKYAHGQAQFVVMAVKLISDTIDVMMPPPGVPRDDAQERQLAKTMERLGSIVNLDPVFLSLELWRFREAEGKGADIPL